MDEASNWDIAGGDGSLVANIIWSQMERGLALGHEISKDTKGGE